MPILFLALLLTSQSVIAASSAEYRQPGPIVLNETLLEYWWNQMDGGEPVVISSLQNDMAVLRSVESAPGVAFSDPTSVLRLVLLAAPDEATVYPTERYYYYKFDLGAKRISGNLRFTDVENGVLHIGYFDDMDQSSMNFATYSDDSDEIRIEYDPQTFVALVEFEGRRVRFRLNQEPFQRSSELTIYPEERYISGILDESGYTLHLLYNNEEQFFYYVRSVAAPSPEPLVPLMTPNGLRLSVGLRSRFVFYHEPASDREYLVGVKEEHIWKNDYYDGPFDQVPPRLSIRDELEAAYPYVSYSGGIDEHGNFRERYQQRVSIAPYQNYSTLQQLCEDLDVLYRPFETGSSRWIMFMYEWKRDFHHTLPGHAGVERSNPKQPHYVHETATSLQWPSNHWVGPSQEWPTHHHQQLSPARPANSRLDNESASTDGIISDERQ